MANLQRLRNTPGLTPESICLRLYELAKAVPGDEAIVEIGVYKGRTVCYLGLGARHGEQPQVVGIDPWDLQDQRTQSREQQRLRFAAAGTRRVAERTVQQQGMRSHVTLIQGFSTQVAESWDGPKVGLLYVDGDHEAESVLADVRAWLPHLAEGPVIAFDDYGVTHNPGVAEAVNQLVEEGLLTVEEVIDGQLAIATLTAGHEPVEHDKTEAPSVEKSTDTTETVEKIEGEVVETDTEPGEAVNADTGEVTPPGEPLPEIPDRHADEIAAHDRFVEAADKLDPATTPAKVLDPESPDHPGKRITEERPAPPPRSGAGSGVGAWREYAAQVTTRPAQTWAKMNRQEVIDELTAMGAIE